MGSVTNPSSSAGVFFSGNLAADSVVGATTTATVMTIPVTAGTWLLSVGVDIKSGSTVAEYEVTVTQGSATAVLTGNVSGTGYGPSAAEPIHVHIVCEVAVTVAGNLNVNVRNNGAGGCTVKATTNTTGFTDATGWVLTN